MCGKSFKWSFRAHSRVGSSCLSRYLGRLLGRSVTFPVETGGPFLNQVVLADHMVST